MTTKLIDPIECVRTRKSEPIVAAVGIALPVNQITERLFPSGHIAAAPAVYRALFGALARRALLDATYEPGAHLAAGLNLSAYVFPVTQLASALEALKDEVQQISAALATSAVVGYWCPEEKIYRNWYPNSAPFDLHRLLTTVDWDRAEEMMKRRAEAIAAEWKAQQDQHGQNGS